MISGMMDIWWNWKHFPGHLISYAWVYASLRSVNKQQNNELHGFSPQANYTDRAIAACRWS
jgi:hypothetical protein